MFLIWALPKDRSTFSLLPTLELRLTRKENMTDRDFIDSHVRCTSILMALGWMT